MDVWRKRLVLLMGALCACVGQARADIEFEATMAGARVARDGEPVAIVYPFRNTGSTPVAITRVRVSCGCMSAREDDRIYQPGEEGEVRVWFNPAGREGVQKRAVSVHVLDGDIKRRHLLGLEVTIGQ